MSPIVAARLKQMKHIAVIVTAVGTILNTADSQYARTDTTSPSFLRLISTLVLSLIIIIIIIIIIRSITFIVFYLKGHSTQN